MAARRKGSPVGAATVLFCVLMALVELGLTTAATGGFDALAIPLFLGLWMSFALLWSGLEWVVLRVAFGPSPEHQIRDAFHSAWATRLRRPAPGLSAAVILVPALLGVWVWWARFVVEAAHHPTWIALAIVAGEGILAAAAFLAWRAISRLLRGFPLTPSGRTVIRGVVVLGAVVSLFVLVRRWDDLTLVGAHALLLPALALTAAHLLAIARWFRIGLGPISSAILVLVAFGALSLGEQGSGARGMVGRSAWTSTYLRTGLGELADLDRDGTPAFPFGDDCAPLDPSVHPFAFDPAGNGVDENCDGSDEFRVAEGERGPPQPLTEVQPDLVLITVDALRADHLGFMGYDRPLTPDLDREAAEGVVFERAFSQDSGTGPSLWSLMTGKTPFQVDLRNASRFPPEFGPDEKLLAELLKDAGYRTEAHLCGYVFATPHWNLNRGFDEYHEVCGPRREQQGGNVQRPAFRVLRREDVEAPLFLWVHFYDPHDPYFDHPGEPYGVRPIDHYDEEIQYVQRYIAQVVREARSPRRRRPTFVFLTADHGENFLEHGRDPHARTLYREVTNVPLVVWGPNLGGRRVESLVASSDLYPTLLDLAHVATPSASSMVSLVPILRGGDGDPDRVVYQENSWSRPRRHVKGLIRGKYHYIRDLSRRTNELYDMRADPAERRNLSGTGLPVEEQLGELMDEFVPTTHVPEDLR